MVYVILYHEATQRNATGGTPVAPLPTILRIILPGCDFYSADGASAAPLKQRRDACSSSYVNKPLTAFASIPMECLTILHTISLRGVALQPEAIPYVLASISVLSHD